MNIKIVVAVVGLILSSLVQANPLSTDVNGVIYPPSCKTPTGHVTYFQTDASALNRWGISIAMALKNFRTNQNKTFYDYESFKTFSPEFQAWVFAHECVHHQLGHTSMHALRASANPLVADELEKAADCGAVRILSYFTDKQWEQVFTDMGDAAKLTAAGAVVVEPDEDHPGMHVGYDAKHKDRIKLVKQCLASNRR